MPSSALSAPVLSSLTLAPPNIQSGDSSTGTVTFDSAAPSGGLTVALSSNASIAVVPATVVVAEGASSATFTVTTGTQFFLSVPTISASFEGTIVAATLFVGPSSNLAGILIFPSAVEGGSTAAGDAALGNLAPVPGGVVVTLSSSNPAVAAVPATVTVPYGNTLVTYSITTTAVSTPTLVTISGTYPVGITRSATLTVLPPSNALFDATLGVPGCLTVGSFCDTGASLISGRSSIAGGPELHAPNTINGSCPDGTDGTFQASESLDRLRIWSLDGNPLAAGRLVQVDAYIFSSDTRDALDLFFAPDATNPTWTLISTLPSTGGTGQANILSSAPFTLPPSLAPAIRANWRTAGPAGPCTSGPFDDRDDLVFAVGAPVNAAPIVNADPDQTITLPAVATLAGTVTDDGLPGLPATLGTTWSTVSGPGTVTFGDAGSLQATASFSTAGSYVLRLTANDGALSASDDLTVTVLPPVPVNQPPSVNAGDDQTVTLSGGARLAGNASDDGLPSPPATVTTTWSKESGPGTVTFSDPTEADTPVTFSATGVYILRMTVTDGALLASDTVVITVRPTPRNAPPRVNAGSNITVILPASAMLNGSASDDGLPDPPGVVTTTWSKVRGPGSVTFANPGSPATRASFSAMGSYVLRLRASDGTLFATDDLTVVVKAAPVNTAPVVNAGPDISVTLPASATLNGSVSDDGRPNPPGVVTTTWSKVSGPGTVAFAHGSAKTTTTTFSTAGTYVVKLTANDGALSGSDTAQVIVTAPSPCANLCANPVAFTVSGRFQSGGLGTGAVCYQTTSPLHGGNCGNFVSPRTLKVNGVDEFCNGSNWPSIPSSRNGGYCIQAAVGNRSSAFFTAF